ncbi:MAG: DEAD/DEAH box helicase [Pseudomonadota bacterium]
MTTFDALGLSPRVLKALTERGFDTPTPIQEQAIPVVLDDRDIMGLAQTGTGKTAAFGLPLIHKMLGFGVKPEPKTVRALILAPTRELAKQISDELKLLVQKTPLKIALVVRGGSLNAQANRLQRGTDILVATPGRLIDLMDRRALTLTKTGFLVLDEADQMLDMGFIPALRKIAALLPEARQTLLFSATMPKQMAELSATYLTDPVRIEVSPVGRAADKIAQTVHFVDQKAKTTLLKDLLAEHRAERALVFCRTKHGAERLMKQLVAADFAAASIHGNKSQGQRDRALKSFKAGKTTVLVATDVAARGIDVPGVRFVYNYELPNVAENYVHRIGRTARAGADGAAVALCAPHEMADLRAIEKAMKQAIPVAGGEPFAEQGATAAKPGRKPGTRRRRPRRPGRGGKPSRIAA